MCITTGRADHRVFALLTLALLAGCQKIAWYRHNGKGDTDDKTCRIMKITAPAGPRGPIPVHYVFSYNKLGDPVSIVNDQVSTGNPNLFFVYDKYNRLSQLIRPYEGGSYETWERYGYDNRGRIVRDTTFGFGQMSATGPLETDYFGYSDIFYDALGRISQMRDSIFRGNQFLYAANTEFAYNDSSNRVKPDFRQTYDNKLNLHRTNKIWMFICRDYSVNNPFTASAYNEHGLPLTFDSKLIENLGTMAPTSGNIVVDYYCNDDLPPWPSK